MGYRQSKVDEMNRLIADAQRLSSERKMDEALNSLIKAKKVNRNPKITFYEASISEEFGNCFLCTGEYEKSIEMFNYARALFKKVSGHFKHLGQVGEANSLMGVGRAYDFLGKYEVSIEYYEQVVELALKVDDLPNVGVAYGNMGRCYNEMENHTKALEFCQKSLRINKTITGDKFEKARNLQNISTAYYGLRKYKESIENCNESARIATEIGNMKLLSTCYGILGMIYIDTHNVRQARHFYKKCIEFNLHMKHQDDDLAIVYGNLARTEYLTGLSQLLSYQSPKETLEKSVESYKSAIESAEKILACLSEDNNKTAFSERFYRWHDNITAPFILLGRIEAALLFLDLGRAKILRHLVNKQVETEKADREKSNSSWLSIEDGQETERIRTLFKQIQSESNSTVLFYNFNTIKILTIWVVKSGGSVHLKSPDPIKFTLKRDPIMLMTALTELEGNIGTLLEKASIGLPRDYSFLSPTFAFKCMGAKEFVPEQNSPQGKNTGQKAKVAEGSGSSRSPALKPEESCEDEIRGARSDLYRLLISPVKDFIEGTKLIIVPQKCIFFAPFSCFLDEELRPLSEQYEIQITPSLHVLAINRQMSSGKRIGNSLFIGNPEDGNERLPSAEEEVRYLASLLQAKPLTGRLATKERVLHLMPAASIIHVAAHGDEQAGHVFLASEGKKGARTTSTTSSILTQSDVLGCKLSAKLVVLSCCNSGKGSLSSEGVLGIARAFLGAGASSVMVTLWSIDDWFTRLFMEAFYEKILQEKPVCLALKETMNQYQQSGRYTSYLYWASFQILGDDVSFTKRELDEIRRNNKEDGA